MKLSERVMKEDNFTKKEWLGIFESDRIDTLELLHEDISLENITMVKSKIKYDT